MGLPLLVLEVVLDLYEDAEMGPGLDAYAARVEAFRVESDRIVAEARELLGEVRLCKHTFQAHTGKGERCILPDGHSGPHDGGF
jgi:hypothetical protein